MARELCTAGLDAGPVAGGLDPRPARRRSGRSPDGARGPRAARRGGSLAPPDATPELADVRRHGRLERSEPAASPGRVAQPSRSAEASRVRQRSSSKRARPGWAAIACWTSWAKEAKGSSIAPRTRPTGPSSPSRSCGPTEPTTPMVLRRFRKEARLMAEANNPHVVNLLEFNEDDGIPYMVLEFVGRRGPRPPAGARTRLDEARGARDHGGGGTRPDGRPRARDRPPRHQAQQHPAARAAAAAAERPLGEPMDSCRPRIAAWRPGRATGGDGRRPRVKISDFGLARHVVDTESLALTAAGALLGTPHYMAPEQWTGRAVDPRTDVYAMGATLFHLLAGRPPFDGARRAMRCAASTATPAPAAPGRRSGRQRGGRAGGGAGLGQASRGSLRRRRRDAPRPGGPAPRQADRHRDPPAPAGLRPGSGPAVRVPLGAGIVAAAALAAGDQYRPARPSDRVPPR